MSDITAYCASLCLLNDSDNYLLDLVRSCRSTIIFHHFSSFIRHYRHCYLLHMYKKWSKYWSSLLCYISCCWRYLFSCTFMSHIVFKQFCSSLSSCDRTRLYVFHGQCRWSCFDVVIS
jgi:hypothetical protein